MNVCFHLLDDQVIAGRADDHVLSSPPTSFARLLEEVAAFGGVLRAVEVDRGDAVLVDLSASYEAVVAALAVARVGGVLASALADAEPVVVVTDDLAGVRGALDGSSYQPGTVVVHGEHDELDARQELDWQIGMQAGRTDPAPCVELDPETPYDATRTVADVVAATGTLVAQPLEPERLRAVLLPQ